MCFFLSWEEISLLLDVKKFSPSRWIKNSVHRLISPILLLFLPLQNYKQPQELLWELRMSMSQQYVCSSYCLVKEGGRRRCFNSLRSISRVSARALRSIYDQFSIPMFDFSGRKPIPCAFGAAKFYPELWCDNVSECIKQDIDATMQHQRDNGVINILI